MLAPWPRPPPRRFSPPRRMLPPPPMWRRSPPRMRRRWVGLESYRALLGAGVDLFIFKHCGGEVDLIQPCPPPCSMWGSCCLSQQGKGEQGCCWREGQAQGAAMHIAPVVPGAQFLFPSLAKKTGRVVCAAGSVGEAWDAWFWGCGFKPHIWYRNYLNKQTLKHTHRKGQERGLSLRPWQRLEAKGWPSSASGIELLALPVVLGKGVSTAHTLFLLAQCQCHQESRPDSQNGNVKPYRLVSSRIQLCPCCPGHRPPCLTWSFLFPQVPLPEAQVPSAPAISLPRPPPPQEPLQLQLFPISRAPGALRPVTSIPSTCFVTSLARGGLVGKTFLTQGRLRRQQLRRLL